MSKRIETKQDFNDFKEEYWRDKEKPYVFGIARIFTDSDGNRIAAKFLTVNLVEKSEGTAAVMLDIYDRLGILPNYLEEGITISPLTKTEADLMLHYFKPFKGEEGHINMEALEFIRSEPKEIEYLAIFATKNHLCQERPKHLSDVHLRLALLSHLFCEPNEVRVDPKEIMPILPNLVWTPGNVYTVRDWNKKFFHTEPVLAQDKVPPYTWSMPLNETVRIANPQMVPFGAYIGNGTTWGGNSGIISVGNHCLLEVGSEVGIPLGNNCRVCMNTVFHGNTPVYEIPKRENKSMPESDPILCKASDFAGRDNLTFRLNSTNGRIEVLHKPNKVGLNQALHQNGAGVKS